MEFFSSFALDLIKESSKKEKAREFENPEKDPDPVLTVVEDSPQIAIGNELQTVYNDNPKTIKISQNQDREPLDKKAA